MRFKNKVLSVILTLCMLGSTVLGPAAPFVVEAAAWDGTIATGFHSGDGTQAQPYIIETEEEMGYFGSLLSQGVTFEGLYLSLQADLDLSGGTWTPGTFQGNFCGNGHTITLASQLFDTVGENGKVSLVNVTNTSSSELALVCEYNKGVVDGCIARGSVSERESYLSLFCYQNEGTIINAGAIGSVSGTNSYAAGLVYKNSGTIDNAFVSVGISVSSSGKYGGSGKDAVLKINTGTITHTYYSKGTSAFGTKFADDEMKTQEFVNILNEANTSLSTEWRYVEGDFPMVVSANKSDIECRLAFSENDVFIYNADVLTTSILNITNNKSCDIYYTTDGSNPITSATAVKYNGYSVTLTGSGTIRMVACENGVFGKITMQHYAHLNGDGTEANPYVIHDKETFAAISFNPEAHYIFIDNIELTDADFAAGGIFEGGWIPIPEFTGSINGNGYAISNLQGSQGGLIEINKGAIASLRLLDTTISNELYTNFGAIANSNSGTITQCYVDLVSSAYCFSSCYAGGIVGYNSGTISLCSTDGHLTVNGLNSNYIWMKGIGGIAGYNAGTIKQCLNSANLSVRNSAVTEYVHVGGIAGSGWSVTDCASYCSIDVSVCLDYDIYYSPFCATSYSTAGRNCYGDISFSGHGYRSSDSGTYYDCYYAKDYAAATRWQESLYPELDFENTWMIMNGAPVPQGIMTADGKCYTKVSFEEGVAADGKHTGASTYQDQYGSIVTESYPMDCICDTSVWQYDEETHYHTCSCGKLMDRAQHVRNSSDKDCETSACVYCGKELAALVPHEKAADLHDCEEGECLVCGQTVLPTADHTRNSDHATCRDSACIYCGVAMPATTLHYCERMEYYQNYTLSSDGWMDSYGDSALWGYYGYEWLSATDTTYAELTLTAERAFTLDFLYYTTCYSGAGLVIRKNGSTIYSAYGITSEQTASISLDVGDEVTFTYEGYYGYENDDTVFVYLDHASYSEDLVAYPITEFSCEEYPYCVVCWTHVTPDHKSDSPACRDGNCVWCGTDMPATEEHHIADDKTEDVSKVKCRFTNDSRYPFMSQGGWLVSTNHNDASSATYTLTATGTCTVNVSYYTSSESNFDKLIIKKNGTELDTVSGYTSAVSKNIALVAGDVVTFTYQKDGSASAGDDAAYIQIVGGVQPNLIPVSELGDFCDEHLSCYDCGTAIAPTVDHTRPDMPLCADTVCTVCGETLEATAAHTWDEGVVTTNPTCALNGVITYTCLICGDNYTEVIPATGVHTYEYDCDEDCNVCGYVRDDAHSYVWHSMVEPTCGEQGEEAYKCWGCGSVIYYPIPATGEHTYDNACDAFCNVCDYERVPDAHTYEGYVTTEATCGTDGVMTYTCSVCGDSYTEVIYATGEHTYDNACDAFCNVCDYERVPDAHTYEGYVTTEATCGTDGVMTYICSVCGDSYTEVIYATGEHIYASEVTRYPTCAEDGVGAFICSVCGDSYTVAIPATGEHTYDNACDAFCNVCDYERVPAEHKYKSKVMTPATCIADGVMTYTCSVCGDSYTEAIPATGVHTYDDDTDATCNGCGAVRIPPVLPADAPAFVVDNATSYAGKEFTVAVRTERNTGVISFKLGVNYDTDVLELVSAKAQDFTGMSFGPVGNIPFVINWVDALHPNNTTDGVVVLLTFRVKEDVSVSHTEVFLSYNAEDVFDQDLNNVAFRVESGTVEILEYVCGDVNGDNQINNKDWGILQRYLNDWDVTLTDVAADVDNDGRVTNKDLGILQRYLNGWDIELG